ncbi:MAG: hypothetical protein IPL61_32965 [Myxococcales bacterium]|nr:hypothetical protein [Myxococcales bacterium]
MSGRTREWPAERRAVEERKARLDQALEQLRRREEKAQRQAAGELRVVATTERQLVALVGHPKASLSALYVALAVVVLAAVLWPVALTGAAVGEHLAVRRRSRGG